MTIFLWTYFSCILFTLLMFANKEFRDDMFNFEEFKIIPDRMVKYMVMWIIFLCCVFAPIFSLAIVTDAVLINKKVKK